MTKKNIAVAVIVIAVLGVFALAYRTQKNQTIDPTFRVKEREQVKEKPYVETQQDRDMRAFCLANPDSKGCF